MRASSRKVQARNWRDNYERDESHRAASPCAHGGAAGARRGATDVRRRAAERRAEIDRVLAEIDISDSNAILFFGTKALEDVTSIADEMLEGVRSKDTGAAGQALNEMVSTLRGFSAQELREQLTTAQAGEDRQAPIARLSGGSASSSAAACSRVSAHFGRTVLSLGRSTPRAGLSWRCPHFTAVRSTALSTSWM